MAAFPEIDRIRFEGPKSQEPARLPPLQRRRKGRRQDDAGPPAVQRRLLAHVPRHRSPIRSAPARAVRPWEDGTDSVENAQNRARVAFEFMEKLGAPFYAFHDRDVAPEGANLAETNQAISTPSSRCSRKSSSAPASSCSGAPPTCSATAATCTARRPARTPRRSPSPPRR